MTKPTASTPPDRGDQYFDLSQIFIGRDQQLDLFDMYLTRWQRLMSTASLTESALSEAPSPNNKIQGLIVLLYGRGGFGKSTLLKHYRNTALQADRHLTVSKIIDWEFAVEGRRGIFNPPKGQPVDGADYFKALCVQLAEKLDRKPGDFKQYQRAMQDVDEARKKAQQVIDSLSQDERFKPLRWVAGEGLIAVLREIPFLRSPLSNELVAEKVKGLVGEGTVITAEQVMRLHDRLHDRLGTQYDAYLDPALRLGLALGRDLHTFARNFPLLFLLDTYEEIDEGDRLLRMVMGAAGLRVAWVIAGRDNLWAGAEQRERSVATEYGYKDIVESNRAIAIDFNAGGVGAFTLSDIKDYFELLSQQVSYDPPLSEINEQDAQRILDVTQGVPLAVKIAAGLYLDKVSLDAVTETVEGKREIVDQMVRRYLLHARDNAEDRVKLYALAMLHSTDRPAAIASALNLTPEQAKTSYRSELARLQRRYSFIFTEKAEPSLHEEVRHFLRLWLLEHREEPEIEAINKLLLQSHEDERQNLEARRTYSSLKSRLQDDEWVSLYLDLAEQRFWLDPVSGLQMLFPFMLAAAIYRRNANKDAAEIGSFFADKLKSPYRNWWQWLVQGLANTPLWFQLSTKLHALIELEKLPERQRTAFLSPLSDYRQELEAALYWRLAEAFTDSDPDKALQYYEKALTFLEQEMKLKEEAAELYWDIAYQLCEQKKHAECILLLNRCIDLKVDYAAAYGFRGLVYHYLNQYAQAMEDYQRALELDPGDYITYVNRGNLYYLFKQYEKSIEDYNQAMKLDPGDAIAYNNRGVVNLCLENIQQAQIDFQRGREIDPTYISVFWMIEWASMGKQHLGVEIASRLEEIACINPQNYVA